MTSMTRRTMLTMLGATVSLSRPGVASVITTQAPKLRFEIVRDARAEFRWSLKSANGQTIATSGEGYKTKAACRAGIDLVQRGAAGATIKDMA